MQVGMQEGGWPRSASPNFMNAHSSEPSKLRENVQLVALLVLLQRLRCHIVKLGEGCPTKSAEKLGLSPGVSRA